MARFTNCYELMGSEELFAMHFPWYSRMLVRPFESVKLTHNQNSRTVLDEPYEGLNIGYGFMFHSYFGEC